MGAYELPTWFSTGSNAANTLTNWKANTDGTGNSPTAFNNMARYTIQTGHTLNLGGNLGLDSGALFIQTGAGINSTGNLSVGNTLSNNGAVSGAGTAVLKGTMGTPNVLSGTGTISNLTVNNGYGATVNTTGTAQTVTGALTLQSGVLTTNGNITLASNASGTAAIAAIDGVTNTGSITGNITAQRYLTPQRAYRLLGHPFNSGVALNNIQPYVDITGSGTGLTTGNASAFNYITGVWTGYTNNTDLWNKNEALFLFVRGTPGQGIGVTSGGYTPNPVTLQLTGPVNTGNLDYTVKAASSFSGAGAQGWNAIGNPYPAPIDVNSIGNITAPGGTGASIYLWNTSKQSTAEGVASGGYDYYTLGNPILIPMYGAFFINNTSGINQTIHFTENNKRLGTPLALLGGTVQQGFELTLNDTANNYWDKLKVSFTNAAATAATDNEDLVKMSNTSLDFYSISSDNKKLAINSQPLPPVTDTIVIPLGITTGVVKRFVVGAGAVNLPANFNCFLHDKYLQQWVPVTTNMLYTFAISADTASKGNNRFEVLMKPNAQIIYIDSNTVRAPGRLLVTATPNPVINTLTISYASPLALPTTIRITDATSRTVYQLNAGTVQSGTIQVAAAAWSRGVYLVQFIKTVIWVILFCSLQHFSSAQTNHYVDASVAVSGDGSSWAQAFKDFQSGINACGVNDTVLVAQGTYQTAPGYPFDIGFDDYNFQKAGIKIFGGFPSGGGPFAQRNVLNNPTILKGNGAPVVIMGAIGNTEFDGFTIRDGVGTVFNSNLLVVATAGGLLIQSSSGNTYQLSARIIKNCTFTNNSGNYGGAVWANMFPNEGTPTVFANCLFYNNTAVKGGAIYLNTYSLNLYNCSFYNNQTTAPPAQSFYGGFCIWNSSFTGGMAGYNCIFDNELYDDRTVIGIQFTHLENCIYPRTYVLGNSSLNIDINHTILVYPRYVDPANGNFHLLCSSGANNGGNNAKVPAYLTQDLAGNARIRRGTVDMGVFEEIGGDQYTNFYDTICQGNSFVYKGQTLTQTGAYSNTYQTYYGCDSIVTEYLYVLPTTSSEATVITCGGYTANGNTYTTPGTYVTHTTNMYGCDSTITVHLLKVINPTATLYVDNSVAVSGDGSSWANAFQSLSDALLATKYCSTIDTILIAQGTYQPQSGQSFVMTKGVKMFGGFPGGGGSFAQRQLPSASGNMQGGTILTGNGAGIIRNNNNGLTPDDVLDGFTLRDGYVNDESASAGIANINASPTISHCSFLNNFTASDNGGGAMYNNQSSPVISQCIFSGNTSVEFVYPYDGGYSYGGYGGGIASENGSYLVVNNCLFVGNQASVPDPYDPTYYDGVGEGGAIYSGYGSSVTISNCVFANNKAANTAAVSVYEGSSAISNSILYNNSAGGSDPSLNIGLFGGYYGGAIALNNTIVGPGDVSVINQSGATVNGTGNLLNTDPLFVNAAGNDYRLLPNSPAIDAGTADTTGLGIGNADLWNSARIKGNRIDMGIYELPVYYSTGNNSANTLTNWKANTDGTGASPAAFNNLARYTVQQGHTLSVTGSLGLDSSALFIQNNATLNNTGALNVGSTLSNNGSIAGSGTTVLNGSMGSQTLGGTGTISNLTVNNSNGVTVNSTSTSQTLTGVLTLQSGVLTTHGNITLASNATGTAAIAAIDGVTNTGSITGNITAQRYLTAQRAYRLLGHPFSSSIALSNVQPYVDITGTGTGLIAGNASAFYYTTGVWTPYINSTDTWNKNEALFLFVRGTPGQGIGAASGGYTPNAPTIQLTGAVNTGNLDYTVKAASSFSGAGAEGWNAIGNPYPAPIDVNSIGNITAPGGSGASIYLWNTTKQSIAAGVASGGYDYYTLGNPILIPMYGAFFIKNTSGTNQTIHFSENNKQLGTPLILLGGIIQPGFELTIYDTANNYWDKLKVSFNNTATAAATDNEDLEKLSNSTLDFYSISSDIKKLAINSRPALPDSSSIIPLGISTNVSKSFVITAGIVNLPVNAMYYLHDQYTEKWVSITNGMNYPFAINADTASKGNHRFEVLMKPNAQIINVDTNTVVAPGRLLVTATPNPVINTLTISYASPLAVPVTIRITDAAGRTVYQLNAGTIQSGTIQVQAAAWSRGVYLVQKVTGTTRYFGPGAAGY
ncbi:pectin lyase fold/virulence factor [Russula earlei]|uniref:Pectin lyase fold/virulence factor n=1 Tax=Russula earlei TaxID=71964 RepID=A0ACC0TS13_9AGAM|nr:pectin lyase fold/virulence factor [Russula earlei]